MLLFFLLVTSFAWRPNPSYALHNFDDTIMTWCANIDSTNSKGSRPSGLCQFRWATNDYSNNLLQGDGFAFKAGGKSFSDPFKFLGKNTIEYPGEYTYEILFYNMNKLGVDVDIVKRHMMVPNQPILLETYDVTNTGSSSLEVNILDYVNSTIVSNSIVAGRFSSTGAFYFDYKNDYSNYKNTIVVFGMYESDSYSLGSATDYTPIDYFDSNSALDGTSSKTATSMIGAFQKTLQLSAGETKRITIYRALATSTTSAESLSSTIVSRSYDSWLTELKSYSDKKFASYNTPTFKNTDEEKMWYSSVFTVLYSQNPTLGTLVASFHPLYKYKVWARDALFSSIILTAIGEYDGAAKFLRWVATAELRSGGYFSTNYDWWSGASINFVEPQYDSLGVALVAYYYYYTRTGDSSLLQESAVKSRINEIEEFLLVRDYANLVKPDYSIWEESSDGWGGYSLPTQYYAFTQIQSHHGLLCAAEFTDKIYGDSDRASELRSRADELSTAFDQYFWNEDAGYYVQSLWSDTKSQKVLIDSSTATMVYSDIVTNTERLKKHMDKIRSVLTKLSYGIARYDNDPYFYQSKFNPAGSEVGEASPPWGVVTMFMTWAELLADDYDGHAYMADDRLQWMIDHTGPDFIPCGEAVDGVTGDPVMASMPDVYEHAGVYIITVLQNQGIVPLFSYKNWA
ncbi:GH15-like domain-containing protein [Entamoeba marina]